MVGEGVTIFFVTKAMTPGPAAAMGAEGSGPSRTGEEGPWDLAEVELAECRPSNMMSGKFLTFHVRVSGLVAAEDLERTKEMVQAKKARIEDGVNVVIRSAEPNQLSEPGLETLRRRLKHELGRIFDDPNLIKQVVIPSMLQSGPGV